MTAFTVSSKTLAALAPVAITSTIAVSAHVAQRNTGIKPSTLKITAQARNIESHAISGSGSVKN